MGRAGPCCPVHELAVAQSIIDIVETQARAGGFSRVTGIGLEVGEWNGIVPESLRFCFEVAAKGTIVAGANLKIDLLPAKGLCGACDKEFTVGLYAFACAHCGASKFRLIGGKELFITELDVERAGAEAPHDARDPRSIARAGQS